MYLHNIVTFLATVLVSMSTVRGAAPTPDDLSSQRALIQRHLDNYEAAQKKASLIKLGPPSVRPDPELASCRGPVPADSSEQAFLDADTAAVHQLLVRTKDHQAVKLFEWLPAEFMWWLRRERNMTIGSLSTALHETSHALTSIATRCNGKQQVFYFQGASYPVENGIRKTPNYSIAALAMPGEFRSAAPMSRYHRYLVMSQNVSGNNFAVLLDEFGAYVDGAEFEVLLAETDHYANAKNAGLTGMDGNISGTVEFMQFTVAYLKALKQADQASFLEIKKSQHVLKHLQRLWSGAESVLCRAQPYSAQAGGLYHVPPNALKLVYSEWARPVLDELQLSYAYSSQCLSYYWQSPARP